MNPKTGFFLATTADELAWDRQCPLLFLGEWCRLHSRQEVWRNPVNAVHAYHWDDREKYYHDYRMLEALYERRLASLSTSLGRMHGVTQDVRHWRIVIGPWLRFFTDALFDRFECVRSAFASYCIEDTWVYHYRLDHWIPSDFQDFYTQFRDDAWNHIAFAECMREMDLHHTQLDTLLLPAAAHNRRPAFPKRLAKGGLQLYARLLPSRLNRIAMVSTYIPDRRLCKLQWSMGQWPYMRSPELKTPGNPVDHVLRNSIRSDETGSLFERLLDKLIAAWMPKAYLEDFADLRNSALEAFPKNPVVVFTSNAYQADDGFKMWAAHNVARGIPLVIAQHGGNIGIALMNQTEDHQVRIADVFASWGWRSERHPNIRPLPALKLVGERPAFIASGDILITLASLPRYFYYYLSFPVASQFAGYLREQVSFMDRLATRFQGSIRIRLDSDVFGWEIAERLGAAGYGQVIDRSSLDLRARLNGCRICISTYNATVFLESLAMNFPVLAFFNPERFEIRPEARAVMQRLRDVGILHDSPESAARQFNAIGDDIGKWWGKDALQVARVEFCNQYASVSDDWLSVWKTFFQGLAAHYRNGTAR